MTKEEDADQLLAMKWANETVPGWRNTYDLIRRVRSEERESRLRAERERDELRAALKKAHQTEAGFLDRCHEMLDHGGIREHAYCLNVLDDLVRALSSPSVTTGGLGEEGLDAGVPRIIPHEGLQAALDAATEKESACCASSHMPRDTACRGFLAGANGRCVYCDHEEKCHPGPGATCEIGSGESPAAPSKTSEGA